MKTYTQDDYDGFPVVDGIKRCPSGDYSQIKVFAEWCNFGDWCSFGEWCGFEGRHSKDGYPFLTFGGGGSENRTIYCFNTVEGLIFRAGCFVGSKNEFVEKVLGDDESQDKSDLKTKQYLGFIELCELTFK